MLQLYKVMLTSLSGPPQHMESKGRMPDSLAVKDVQGHVPQEQND